MSQIDLFGLGTLLASCALLAFFIAAFANLLKNQNLPFIWHSSVHKLNNIPKVRLMTLGLILLIASVQYANIRPLTGDEINPKAFSDWIFFVLFLSVIGWAFCLLVEFIQRQPQYIVSPFAVPKDKPHLQDVTLTLSGAITTNLREISDLLSARQAATIQVPLENPVTYFVSNDQSADIADQLRDLTDFEAAGFRFPLGPILAFIAHNRAIVRISGSVTESNDGSVEAIVQIHRRGGQGTAEPERHLIPSDTSRSVNDQQMKAAADQLANKLAFALGSMGYIASNWENFHLYIQGLRATRDQEWWYAYACYSQWTQSEEALRKKTFGVGHFYLGNVLLSQGEPERALRELRKAEENPPVFAETEYNIALVLLAQYASELHTNQSVFAQIEDKLNSAIKRRRVERNELFPEAKHLLGIAYYQRAKLLERQASRAKEALTSTIRALETCKSAKTTDAETVDAIARFIELAPELDHFNIYRRLMVDSKAEFLLKSANGNYVATLIAYKESLLNARKGYKSARSKLTEAHSDYRHYHRDVAPSQEVLHDERLLRHHLGDVQRSLAEQDDRLYAKATQTFESLWNDNPDDIRSFIDLVMTYCLETSWQKAIDAILKVSHRQYTLWHADANLYWGWAEAGKNNAMAISRRKSPNWIPTMSRIDFALSLRPRFIQSRRQTMWSTEWRHQSTFTLEKINAVNLNVEEIGGDEIKSIDVAHAWIALRIHSIDVFSDEDELLAHLKDLFPGLRKEVLYADFGTVYRNLRKARRQLAEDYYKQDRSGRFYPEGRAVRIASVIELQYAWVIHAHPWHQRLQALEEQPGTDGQPRTIPFRDRWEASICVETLSLLCKVYAETGAWSDLIRLAKQGRQLFARWFELWIAAGSRTDSGQQLRRFSPHSIRYHYIAICCLELYGYMAQGNPITKTTTQEHIFQKLKGNAVLSINELEELILTFQQQLHPLYLYISGCYLRSQHYYREAIDQLRTLLEVISPFDPRSFDRNHLLPGMKQDRDFVSPEFASLDLRTKLQYAERVSGQQMFDFLISAPQLHKDIATAYGELGDYDSAVKHLHSLLETSAYNDLDIVGFFQLASYLLRLNRFDEALAVVTEGRARHSNLDERQYLNVPSEKQFQVLQCVVLTRLKRFDESLEVAESLVKQAGVSGQNSAGETYPILLSKFMDLKLKVINVLLDKENQPQASLHPGLAKDSADPGNAILTTLRVDLKQDLDALFAFEIGGTPASRYYEVICTLSELFNNITYNRVKFGLSDTDTKAYVLTALLVIEQLQSSKLVDHHKSSILFNRLQTTQAHYQDTLSWVYYRHRIDVDLSRLPQLKHSKLLLAEKELTDAIRTNFGYPVSHYHLARVYISIYETLWNWGPTTDSSAITISAAVFNLILGKAQFHSELAQRFDDNNSLDAELRKLRERIGEYMDYLKDAQIKNIVKREAS